jgi:hypothetical protein
VIDGLVAGIIAKLTQPRSREEYLQGKVELED